jgi:hypothetical protein
MKKFSLLAVLAMAVFTFSSRAAVGDVAFSLSGGAAPATNRVIVPVPPGGGQAKVTSLAGITDRTGLGFVWYSFGDAHAVNAVSAIATNEFRLINTTITNNDVVVLYQPAAGTYTKLTCTNATYTNIICSGFSPAVLAVGDVIWKGTASQTYPLTTATATAINGYGGILYGQQGKPLLIEVSTGGTNAAAIYWVSGEYIKP